MEECGVGVEEVGLDGFGGGDGVGNEADDGFAVLVHGDLGDEIFHVVVRVAFLDDGGIYEAELVAVEPHDGLGYEAAEYIGEAEGDVGGEVHEREELAADDGVLGIEGCECAVAEDYGRARGEVNGGIAGEAVDGVYIGVFIGQALPYAYAAGLGGDVFFDLEVFGDEAQGQAAGPYVLAGIELVDVDVAHAGGYEVELLLEGREGPVVFGYVVVVGIYDVCGAGFDGTEVAEHFAAVVVVGEHFGQGGGHGFLVGYGYVGNVIAMPVGRGLFIAYYDELVVAHFGKFGDGERGLKYGGDNDGFVHDFLFHLDNLIGCR